MTTAQKGSERHMAVVVNTQSKPPGEPQKRWLMDAPCAPTCQNAHAPWPYVCRGSKLHEPSDLDGFAALGFVASEICGKQPSEALASDLKGPTPWTFPSHGVELVFFVNWRPPGRNSPPPPPAFLAEKMLRAPTHKNQSQKGAVRKLGPGLPSNPPPKV